jgi:transcriptional regulator with XRE-family HTH domain
MSYATEDEVRRALTKRLRTCTQSELAREVGVGRSTISMAAAGAPVTGKMLEHLGFERVKQRVYRRLSFGAKRRKG